MSYTSPVQTSIILAHSKKKTCCIQHARSCISIDSKLEDQQTNLKFERFFFFFFVHFSWFQHFKNWLFTNLSQPLTGAKECVPLQWKKAYQPTTFPNDEILSCTFNIYRIHSLRPIKKKERKVEKTGNHRCCKSLDLCPLQIFLVAKKL